MLTYGSRSPIGSKFSYNSRPSRMCSPALLARQERLLQGLMTEIVRMTSQMQPLEVGVPLYPFSHAGVFPKETIPQDHTGAPLPDSSQYPEASESPTGMTGLGGYLTSASSPGSWTSPTLRSSRPYSHSVSSTYPQ